MQLCVRVRELMCYMIVLIQLLHDMLVRHFTVKISREKIRWIGVQIYELCRAKKGGKKQKRGKGICQRRYRDLKGQTNLVQ